ncbi:MAG: response regulator transcription factor [Nitratireductor sp.]|nr:response regulator transcription factor [Nitratireductor sp.]
MAEKLSILIADDHPLFRDALASAISGLDIESEVSLAGNFNDAISALAEGNGPDIVLLDLNMPGSRGLSGLNQLRGQYPACPVVVVSAVEDPNTIRRSLAMGASGYVPKSSSIEEMRNAIRSVLDGDIYVPQGIDLDVEQDAEEAELIDRMQSLTPQQSRVLGMLGEGLLNKQIAYELGVSEATVKAHVSAILLKLGVDSRTQAVILLSKFSTAGEGGTDEGGAA